MSATLSVLAGAAAGILSAWGVGGGSLLIIYMTAIAGLAQQTAQGINLLYFLPTALAASWTHLKNKLVVTSLAVPAIIAGVISAITTAIIATGLDTSSIKKIFGVFICIVGLFELFRKSEKKEC